MHNPPRTARARGDGELCATEPAVTTRGVARSRRAAPPHRLTDAPPTSSSPRRSDLCAALHLVRAEGRVRSFFFCGVCSSLPAAAGAGRWRVRKASKSLLIEWRSACARGGGVVRDALSSPKTRSAPRERRLARPRSHMGWRLTAARGARGAALVSSSRGGSPPRSRCHAALFAPPRPRR